MFNTPGRWEGYQWKKWGKGKKCDEPSESTIYLFFLPLFPLFDAAPEDVGTESKFALPCVAPPPPAAFFLRPCPKVDLSLFFNHRSGSGGGVTPGTTPAGTRFIRTFFVVSMTFWASSEELAKVAADTIAGVVG